VGENAGVTLPLYLTSPGALAGAAVGGRADLDGAEARHAVAVRRTAVGELVQLADGEGALVVGPVVAAAPDRLTIRVDEVHDLEEPSPRFVLVQALAKNDRDDQAIEAATELGVDEVIPWQSERCIVQWRGERGEKAHRKWDQVLLAATKQSRRARRPALAPLLATSGLAQRVERVVREGGRRRARHRRSRGRHRTRRGRVPHPGRGPAGALGQHRPAFQQRRTRRPRRPQRPSPLAVTITAR
jgi:16S rRNA U1498 N3-methylase RsmE